MTARSVSGQLPVPQSRVYLKRNCLLRLETSMVSMSITWMSRKPSRAYRQIKKMNTKNKVTTADRSRRWTQKTRSQLHTDQEDEHRKQGHNYRQIKKMNTKKRSELLYPKLWSMKIEQSNLSEAITFGSKEFWLAKASVTLYRSIIQGFCFCLLHNLKVLSRGQRSE